MCLLLIRVPKSFSELGENTVIFKFLSEMFYCKTCQKTIQIFFFLTLGMYCLLSHECILFLSASYLLLFVLYY